MLLACLFGISRMGIIITGEPQAPECLPRLLTSHKAKAKGQGRHVSSFMENS